MQLAQTLKDRTPACVMMDLLEMELLAQVRLNFFQLQNIDSYH